MPRPRLPASAAVLALALATACTSDTTPCVPCDDASDGDGAIVPPEDASIPCADGVCPDACIGTCAEARCGDGHVDPERGEACDLGPGCSAACTWVPCPAKACQRATRDPHGQCVYVPTSDGQPCDDGQACTAGDTCAAGECVGTPRASTLAITDVRTRYGAEPHTGAAPTSAATEGLAAFLADDRIVFLESTSLSSSVVSVVDVVGDALVRVGSAPSRVAYNYDIRSVAYWGYEPTTHLVPLTATRFAVVGSGYGSSGVEVFELQGTALVPIGFTRLPVRYDPGPEDGLIIRGAAGRAGALFLCGDASRGRRLRAYTLDAPTATYTKVADIATPSGGCNELALDPTGTRLFLAANGGYRVYDVTDPAVFAVPASPEQHVVLIPDHFVEDVDVSTTHVAALTARVAGELASVALFSRDGVAMGPVSPATAGAVPFGMALTDEALFVAWREGTYASPSFVARAHDLAASGAPGLASRTLGEGCCGAIETAVTPSARGRRLVAQPTRHVLALVPDGDALRSVTGLEHGATPHVLRTSHDGALLALGATSAHRVELGETGPSFTAGGMILPASSPTDRIVWTPDHVAPRFFPSASRSIFDPLEQEGVLRVELLDASTFPPTRSGLGVIAAPASRVPIAFADGALVQITTPSDTTLRIRWFASANLVGGDGSEWMPWCALDVPRVASAEFPRTLRSALGVSEDGRHLLLIETRVTVDETPARFAFALLWLEVDASGVVGRAETTMPTSEAPHPIDIVVRPEGALVLGTDSLATFVPVDDVVARPTFAPLPGAGLYRRILAFDGEHAMVARHDWDPGGTDGDRSHYYAVDVIDGRTLARLASTRTLDEVMSVETVGEQLVFGATSSLEVASPWCPTP